MADPHFLGWHIVAVFALAASVVGCTATVAVTPGSIDSSKANTTTRIDGSDVPAIDGDIEGGDHARLMVRRCNDGVVVALDRSDVRDIDHPGDLVAASGLVFVGVGAVIVPLGLVMRRGISACTELGCSYPREAEGAALATSGGLLAGAGLALSISGFVTWSNSRTSATPPPEP